SQYFGVAQRRRRVFIVASLGSGAAAQVLFEREGVPGHPAPGRETRPGFAAVAGTLSANRGGTDRPAGNANELDFCIPVATAVNAHGSRCYDFESETFVTSALTRNMVGGGGGADDNAAQAGHILAYNWQSGGDVRLNLGLPSLSVGQTPAVAVRRLTPLECERLQGFPDCWTDGQSDAARYRQMGNA